MTNSNALQFQTIWNTFAAKIDPLYNVGREMRSTYMGKDRLFIMRALVKHSGAWDFFGRMFGIKGSTFERTMTSYISKIAQKMYDYCSDCFLLDTTMRDVIEDGKGFNIFHMQGTQLI